MATSRRKLGGFALLILVSLAGVPLTFEPIVEGPFSRISDSVLIFVASLFGALIMLSTLFATKSQILIGRFSLQQGLAGIYDALRITLVIGSIFTGMGIVGLATVLMKDLPEANTILPMIVFSAGMGCLVGSVPAYLLVKSKHERDDV